MGEAASRQGARVGAEPHRTPLVGDGVLIVKHGDDGVWRVVVELGAVGVLQADDVAGELDDGALQAETDAEERRLLFAGIADGIDFAAGTAIVEPAWNKDPVEAGQDALGPFALDLLGFDLANDDARVLR